MAIREGVINSGGKSAGLVVRPGKSQVTPGGSAPDC